MCITHDNTTRLSPAVQQVTSKDIRPVRRFCAGPPAAGGPLGTVLQFLGWSVGLTGLFAASTACPCCGQVNCPLGVGAMGIMAL